MASPLQKPAAASDLISFLKALPDCRMRRGIRFPQWWMLLVAILAILSNQGSLMGMERFAKRHRKTLNELLGTQVAKPPSDSTFRLLLAQLDVEGFEGLLQQWMAAQPGVTETVDTLVCDGKTLRGSIDETASGAARFIAQVSLYSNSLGVAIAQSTYATDAGGEIAALRQLLDRVELEGLLVQADALHANRPFFLPRTAWCRLPDCGETQPPQGFSGDQGSPDLWQAGAAADQQARAQTRPGHHLDAAGHAGSGVGSGELAWQRHGDRRAWQGHPRWQANRRDPLLRHKSAHWRRSSAASRA